MLTKVESSRIVATDCNSGHVLVVDDDPAVRHLISDYFGQHGIQTVSAMGRSAVARQLAGGGHKRSHSRPAPRPGQLARSAPGNSFRFGRTGRYSDRLFPR
ncbi:hypothetical protein [Bradyrhizobium sp. AZCC 2230]|uniref:hypothetical protein n=1 Tax=Bradyrhizobium sp. AZCC 2230 TaxID=3117021 RepID=UPI00305D43B2